MRVGAKNHTALRLRQRVFTGAPGLSRSHSATPPPTDPWGAYPPACSPPATPSPHRGACPPPRSALATPSRPPTRGAYPPARSRPAPPPRGAYPLARSRHASPRPQLTWRQISAPKPSKGPGAGGEGWRENRNELSQTSAGGKRFPPPPPPARPGAAGGVKTLTPASSVATRGPWLTFFFWSPPEGPLRVYAAFSLETFADDVGAARPFQPRRTGARCKGPGFSGSWRWLLHVCGADPRDPDGGARETRARTSWARRAC